MQPPTVPSAYIVNAPTEFIRQFGNGKSQADDISIDIHALEHIVAGFISMLKSYHTTLLQLSPEEARALIQNVQSPLSAPQAVIEINVNELQSSFQESLVALAQLTQAVHERISLIANRKEIDEESADYQSFLVDLAQEISEKDNDKVYGKDSLMALFD